MQLGLDDDDVEMVPDAADFGNSWEPSKKKLDLVQWIAAYQCFALASDAAEVGVHLSLCILLQLLSGHLQVWKYTAAMAHFRNCLEVAAGAAAEKRRYTLAITYDELCRKHWNQKAARGDRDFDINTVSLVKDKDLLERARALFDASNAGSKGN